MGRPHGVSGVVVVHDETDNPRRFSPGARLIRGDGGELTVRTVGRTDHPSVLLVRFEGVGDREAAEGLRGTTLWVGAAERRSLEPGEYWPDDLVGLLARTPDGRLVGTVRRVVEGAAQERLEIDTPDGRRVEVPFVSELVPEVDLSAGVVVVVPLPGLL